MAKKPVRDASHHLTNVKLAHRPPPPNRDDCPKASACSATKRRKKVDNMLARAWLGPVAATEIRAAPNRICNSGGAIAAAAKSAPPDFLG